MDDHPTESQQGLKALLERSLVRAIWNRRTHRVSRGSDVMAHPAMRYVSPNSHDSLSELEEAVLIAITGCTGLTMPDRPFLDEKGGEIMSKPNLNMAGRTAGSPDNAQGTHFFMFNDSGTYYLRKLPPPDEGEDAFTPGNLIARARQAKVKLFDHRLDVGEGQRDFPAYFDSNRFLSNKSGTTVLFPVVDLSRQYINGLMYLLTQPDGTRPMIVDDRNFYRAAGTKSWAKNGFLNKKNKLPLGLIGTLRTQIEADLLVQNLMLVADAMGLGAWIHASMSPPIALGDPKFSDKYGRQLGFDFVTPKWKPMDALRWHVPLPWRTNVRAHPVGLRHKGEVLIKGMCPTYYDSMNAAVDAVMKDKFEAGGIYEDRALFAKIYKEDYGNSYLTKAPEYDERVIDCAKDICNYIYDTHGRFPAHVDAIFVPGVWVQVHHVEIEYYDRFFRNGLREAHRSHDADWH
jgi:hypothetical protein